ncbi:MAG: response regulator [Planctomycetes bacterium]|nr:response regulator [Planctomycetota bacterium]
MSQTVLKPSMIALPTVILLVDDQPIIGAAVKKILAGQTEWQFHFCAEPSQAVEQAVALKPTVILQDLVMPGIDGLDLVRAYRERPELKDVPLVVLSSKEEAETKAKAFALGANDYLVKLPDPVEMIARLRHHSEGYKALRERNAAFAALAKSEQHLQNEVRRAAEYVRSLLPPPLTDGPARADWRFVPSESLGGDAFGYHWLDERRLAIYLLDVCGHGVGPALLGVSAMNVIHSGALPGRDMGEPGAVMEGLNELFPMERHNEMFFTLWYGILDVQTGSLRWSGGAHPPAVLIAPDGSLTRLDSQGLMIGAAAGVPYDTDEIIMQPGSRLLLYSDGIYELQQPGGPMATLDEYLHAVAARPNQDLDEMLAHARTVQASDNFKDDVSVLELRFQA